eukprot:m.73470 g.73470  ORF g.73470 m.73470 type:complete len:293 (+) comp50301_c0_seq19:60-938(+)
MDALTDNHRIVLQWVMSRQVVAHSALRALHARVLATTHIADSSSLNQFVGVINDALSPLFMKIASVAREDTGERMWALINEADDEHAKLATSLKPQEIAYFRLLIDRIMSNPRGLISSTDAMNLPSEASATEDRIPLTKSACSDLCKSFAAKLWLLEPTKGYYSLGPRAISELSLHLTNAFPDQVRHCGICKSLAILGDVCGVETCPAKFHWRCLVQYFQQVPERICASCKKPWAHPLPAVTLALVEPEPQAPPPPAASSRASQAAAPTTAATSAAASSSRAQRSRRQIRDD